MIVSFEVSYVTFLEFENILKKHYKSSYEQSEMVFNFERVKYIALPQLCYLFGWIEKLLKRNIKVTLDFEEGSGNDIFKVIKGYGFFSSLIKYQQSYLEIKYNEKTGDILEHIIFSNDVPIINFQIFETKENYRQFLNRLKTANLKKKSDDINDDKELIDRSGVRDIFLKELGDNVFDHSNGSPAFIAVSKKSKENLLSKTNPTNIRNYANTALSEYYIEVVVTDLGVGIPDKISKAFNNDKDAHKILKLRNEPSKIEYSFWRDTSSKDTRKLEEIINDLKTEHLVNNLVAPTGLFLVYQLALEYKGFLYCRSGRSIVSWDFSNGIEHKLEAKTWRDRKLFSGPYERIDGNILSVILPVKTIYQVISEEIEENIKGDVTPVRSKYISIHEIIKNFENEDEGVLNLLRKIKFECRNIQNYECLIIDFAYVEVQTRSLYWILIFCMYWRYKKRYIVIVDIEYHQKQLLKDQIKKEQFDYSETPLYPIQCYASIEKNSEQIKITYKNKSIKAKNINAIWLRHELKTQREKIIIDYLKKAYKPDEKVYLPGPSKGFLKGYYELADTLSDNILSYLISSVVCDGLEGLKITYIVLTTNILEKVAKNITSFFNVEEDRIFVPKNEASLTKIALKARKEEGKILIISDVNVTFNTVLHYVERIGCEAIVVSIINGGKRNELISKLILKAIYIHSDKLKFYPVKPKKWEYDTIRLVDPVTHKLLYEKRGTKKTLWDNVESNYYLEDWSKNKGLVISGHVRYGFVCYLYFFNMETIVDSLLKKISIEVNENVSKVLEIRKHEMSTHEISTIEDTERSKISYVVYPILNKAAEKICHEIRTYLGGELLYLPRITNDNNGTSYPQNPYAQNLKKNGTLIFFDTAATTTKTIRNILQLAGDVEADLLLIYLLINRISDDWPTFIEGIDVFKGCDVQIKSFMKIGLPVHSANSCPLCKLREKIDRVLLGFLPDNCKKLLKVYKDRFETIDLIDVRELGKVEGDKDIMYKQIIFRDQIEKMTSMVSLEDKNVLAQVIESAYSDKVLQKAILSALSLEIEFFLNTYRYQRIFDSQTRSAIQSLAYDYIFSDNKDEDAICHAIRVCSILEFNKLMQELSRKKISIITDKIIETLITCIFIYRADISLDKCVQLLETLNTHSCEFDITNLSKSAISESAFYFRYQSSILAYSNTPYTNAYKNLINIYEQRDRSHTEIQTNFSSLERIVKKDDIRKKVQDVYNGENGLRQIFMNILIPSLRKIIEAWPEKLSFEIKKLTDDIYQNLIELDQILINCYNLLQKSKLDDEIWIIEKEKLYKTLTNLNRAIFPSKGNSIKNYLEETNCIFGEVIKECLRDLEFDFRQNNIVIRIHGNALNEISLIPKIHIKDVFRTIIDNICKYSENNTTGKIIVQKFDGKITIDFESSPKEAFRIQERPEHGLSKATSILLKYDSDIKIINPGIDQNQAKIRVSINN